MLPGLGGVITESSEKGLPKGSIVEGKLLSVALLALVSQRNAICSKYWHFGNSSMQAKKPDVSNFKIFGCTAYLHISNQERRQWDAMSVKRNFHWIIHKQRVSSLGSKSQMYTYIKRCCMFCRGF